MNPALWISKTGLDAQQTGLSVITNNLANVNTVGFKKGRAKFEDLMYQIVSQPGGNSSQNTQLTTGLTLGTGVKTAATEKIFTTGSVIQTNNPLDISINGQGFFQVQRADGSTAYTRDGHFTLDSTGQIVTLSGLTLQPSITVPQGTQSISIGEDGTVQALASGASAPTTVGTIQLADFINPAGLQPIGGNLFLETASSGTVTTGNPGTSGIGITKQGSLEASNVNVVEELVNLIETQRAYEMNAKGLEISDQMLQYINQHL